MDDLDRLILRKRRDHLLNPISAPLAFLEEILFNYTSPQPIPGAHLPQTNRRESPNLESVKSTLWADDKTKDRASAAQAVGAERRSERVAAARASSSQGEVAMSTVLTRRRESDEMISHNTRSKQNRDSYHTSTVVREPWQSRNLSQVHSAVTQKALQKPKLFISFESQPRIPRSQDCGISVPKSPPQP